MANMKLEPQPPQPVAVDFSKFPFLAMSVAQYARLTSQGISTVYRQITNLELPARKSGCRTIILLEDALPFLRALPYSGNID